MDQSTNYVKTKTISSCKHCVKGECENSYIYRTINEYINKNALSLGYIVNSGPYNTYYKKTFISIIKANNWGDSCIFKELGSNISYNSFLPTIRCWDKDKEGKCSRYEKQYATVLEQDYINSSNLQRDYYHKYTNDLLMGTDNYNIRNRPATYKEAFNKDELNNQIRLIRRIIKKKKTWKKM